MKPTKVAMFRIKYYNTIKMYLRIRKLKILGMQIGENSKIGENIQCLWPSSITIGCNCEIQENVLFRVQHPFSSENYVKLGDGVFIGNDCEFNSATNITIGDNCLIASRNIFVDGGHEVDPNKIIKEQGIIISPIVIGSDVWIGTDCKILKGVTIGDGAVVGAGSVVNKSIPPYEVWAGVPAKYIKKRI